MSELPPYSFDPLSPTLCASIRLLLIFCRSSSALVTRPTLSCSISLPLLSGFEISFSVNLDVRDASRTRKVSRLEQTSNIPRAPTRNSLKGITMIIATLNS